jgi:hypothetical protein
MRAPMTVVPFRGSYFLRCGAAAERVAELDRGRIPVSRGT